ncbi:MAG: hypothetical protein DYG88_10170 [Chloroflexi bacterium CFX4]|nr:hypothetical protein [Chloroflexi bacterium CFX4]MDL1923773.1 hypothetical protein [Chloroflexi bacterium CFX3]
MTNFLDTLGAILSNAYILFCLALGLWAGLNALRGDGLSGNFWGAMWSGTILGVAGLVVWLLRTLAGEDLRWVYFLYSLFFVLVLPGTFALLRGRDDRTAATIFAGVAIFAALAAISATDPSRGVIVLPSLTPTPMP